MRTLDDVDLNADDFFDFGAGDGGSIALATKLFGGRGLGIDVSPKKVERATLAGSDVVYGDILSLPARPLVRYVTMCDFLEHLPDLDTVRAVLKVAATVATDFIYIRHPSFEDEPYLRSLGLKQYWQDWTGHPSHIMLSDFAEMLAEVGAMPIELEFFRPARDSSDPSVIPLNTPPDQSEYDAAKHGAKPTVEFDRPIHWQIRITAHLAAKSSDGTDIERLQAVIAGQRHQMEQLRNRRSVKLSTAMWRLHHADTLKGRAAAVREVRRAIL